MVRQLTGRIFDVRIPVTAFNPELSVSMKESGAQDTYGCGA
jgi:hypothetical protein